MEYNQLYYGDCLEVMKLIDDKSVDLIVCDLPYGVTQNEKDITIPFNKYIRIKDKNYNLQDFINLKVNTLLKRKKDTDVKTMYFIEVYNSIIEEFNENSKDGLWQSYERIIKDNGTIILFGQGIFFNELINSNPKMFKYDLVWDKKLTSGFLNANRMPLRKHEQIAVFYKKLGTYNPQFTEGKPLHGKGKSYIDKDIINNNYGKFNNIEDYRQGSTEKYPTSILSFQKTHPSKAKHRTEKAYELIEYLIKTYSNENDLVLDNCCGSGGVGVACIKNNRNYILIENDINFYNLTKKELKLCSVS